MTTATQSSDTGRAGDPLRLGRDPSTRFLPWLIGVMTYLAILAVAGGLTSRHVAEQWHGGLVRVLTVQVPLDPAVESTDERPTGAAAVGEVMRVLKVTAGVERVRELSAVETRALLSPWLERGVLRDLPLPILIDVRLLPGAAIDRAVLSRRLSAITPGVIVDDHRQWSDQVRRIAGAVAAIGVAVTVLVAVAAVLAVGFAVRAGLAIHAEVIELLTLIGAHDSYIAGRFQRHVFRLALVGAGVASVLAGASLVGMIWLSGGSLGPGIPLFDWVDLAVLALVPLLVVLLAVVSARRAVFLTLSRGM